MGLKCVVDDDGSHVEMFRDDPDMSFTLPEECSRWGEQVDRLTSTRALPLSRDVWFGGLERQFPLSLDSIRNASAPVQHSGARRRLRMASLKLVRGEPLVISVLGGSMPWGKASSAPNSSGLPERAPYSRFLQEHFRALGFNVTVHNFAEPMSTSTFPMEHVIPFERELNESDVIIVDYSINDIVRWRSAADGGAWAESYGLLVHVLLELPKGPAVVEFATRNRHHDRMGEPKPVACSADITDFMAHFRGVQKFGLPVVSYPDALCHAATPFWFPRPHGIRVHPNATTHDLIARLFLGVFALEGEAACAGDLGRWSPHFPLQLEEYVTCLSSPRTSLNFGRCRGKAPSPPAECENAALRHDAGWRFGADVARKPKGWLADPAAPEGSAIAFPVNVSDGGWIRLDYLATYENIGAIRCQLPGMTADAGCTVNARIASRLSTQMYAYFGITGWSGGPLELVCHAVGGKFKLLGVSAC